MPCPNCFSLDGKRAIVTGASHGLGEGMARGLAGADASVALVSRGAGELERVRADLGGRAAAVPFEVHAEAPFDVLVDRCEEALGGPIDIVLHAAGTQHRRSLGRARSDPKEWQRVLDVNLTAPFLLEPGSRPPPAGGRASRKPYFRGLAEQSPVHPWGHRLHGEQVRRLRRRTEPVPRMVGPEHPRERDRPWIHQDPADRGALRRRRAAPSAHATDPGRPVRHAAGLGRRGHIPGFRRVSVHNRPTAHG